MMVLTLCNFRVDEYMETTIAQLGKPDLKEAKTVIQTLCNEWIAKKYHKRRGSRQLDKEIIVLRRGCVRNTQKS